MPRRIVRVILIKGCWLFSIILRLLMTISFRILVNEIGRKSYVCYPLYLKGGEYISIGEEFWANPGLRIEAWNQYSGIKYCPQIIIGNNVILGFNIHISAISKIEIGNNVLIGSNVLITDNQHGRLTLEEVNTLAINRKLYSKGHVVIEDNVWIGDGVCIMDGVRVGKNAVVGANAVVTRDIPEACVVGGIPAKILRKIDC
jgi:acetyltransferase-like isoleucine patch superfamily enzyme